MPDPETLPQLFQATVARRGDAPALKAKLSQGGWRTITWAGYGRYVQDLTGFLLALGFKQGDRAAILARNGPEWAIADQAITHAGGATVGVYETLAPDKVEYLLRDSGARVAFAGSRAQAEALLSHAKASSLEMVVCAEPTHGALGKLVVDWDEALAQGHGYLQQHPRAFEERWRSVQASDLAGLIYTSGTTGEPKGVMLSHGNFVSNAIGSSEYIGLTRSEDVQLSFLPLSHSFERIVLYTAVHSGRLVAFAESVEKLPANMLEVQPTIMTAVPRLFEKVWARVEEGARETGKEKVFAKAVAVGREHAKVTRAERRKAPFGLQLRFKVFDKLAFAKVREKMGGRIRVFVTGGAHIREDLEWNFTAVGLPVLGGYGLTEASPVISVNTEQAWRPGSVGKPIPRVEVRIAEDGEILCRGPNVMQGYWNKPEETAKVLTDDGWLKTGDIGHLDPDGFLFVTDRKKELFKTSGGKYIAPQPIEDALRSSPLIAEAVAVGDEHHYVTALLIPDWLVVEPWAKKEGIAAGSRHELVEHPRFREALQAEVDKVNARLSKFETLKRWTALDHDLTQEGGELTPTLKVKRRVIQEKYKDLIKAMYPDE